MILRSSFYMSNVLAGAEQVAREGRLFAPAGDARIAMIDPRDVGEAAAAVLTTPGHDGQTYVLTGPEAITYAQVAAELSATLRRRPRRRRDGAATDRAGVRRARRGQIAMLRRALREARDRRRRVRSPDFAARAPAAFAALRARTPNKDARNKALIRRVFEEVIPAGDADRHARRWWPPDFLDHDPLPGQPAGGAGGEYVVTTMHGAHPDLRFTIDDLVAEGDRVTIRWTLRGTNTGPLFGRPPSGRPVEYSAIVIFRIADGRLAERWAGWKPGRAPVG